MFCVSALPAIRRLVRRRQLDWEQGAHVRRRGGELSASFSGPYCHIHARAKAPPGLQLPTFVTSLRVPSPSQLDQLSSVIIGLTAHAPSRLHTGTWRVATTWQFLCAYWRSATRRCCARCARKLTICQLVRSLLAATLLIAHRLGSSVPVYRPDWVVHLTPMSSSERSGPSTLCGTVRHENAPPSS